MMTVTHECPLATRDISAQTNLSDQQEAGLGKDKKKSLWVGAHGPRESPGFWVGVWGFRVWKMGVVKVEEAE